VQVRWPRILALVALVPVVIAGLWVLVRRAPVLAGFFVLYLGVIVVWPFHPHRFLIAMWPLLVLVVAAAARALWNTTGSRQMQLVRVAGFAALTYLVAGHAAYNWEGYRKHPWEDLQRQAGESAKPLVEWVARYTRPDDVLSTEHDVVVYLYTGRKGVPTTTFLARKYVAPFTQDEVVHWVGTMITTYQPRYFVTGWQPHLKAADTLAARMPPLLRQLGSIPNHVVYERVVQ
jgi:hypothetical protein